MGSGVSQRLEAIVESATLAITARAKELSARGEKVVDFGVGEPDFPTPAHVVEAAAAAAREYRHHRYTPTAGLPELRRAVAEKTRRDSGYAVDPGQVLITNGAKGAVFTACQALLDPGDEVLLPAPYWVTYPEAVALAGGVTRALPTTVAAGFRVTVEQLEAARTARTKMLVFVSPSNPTGAVYPPDEVAAIGRWAARHGIWVLTDEIYEHLVYGQARFSSIPVAAPEAAERCVVVNGPSKTYAMTGWRVGWMIAPPAVTQAAIRFQSHAASNVANVSQAATLAALEGPTAPVEEMRAAFDRRRREMYRLLSSVPGVEVAEPQGAFYAFPKVSGLLWRPLGHGDLAADDTQLAALLLDRAKVAVVPGEAFGASGYLRFSFALADADLTAGLERVAAYLAEA
ncbi:MAG: pyridoxal phosphate-dependent aminotransferase [Acidimicrobiia bacterium]|nr:pyridoxal phosphate-dependent aminotransferase [Acidimicrobiia bacterium]